MNEYRVSSRYAKALLALSEEKGAFEEVSKDVELIFEAMKSSRELRKFLKSPVVTSQQKTGVLKNIFADKISGLSFEFLLFLIEKGRENMIEDIAAAFMTIRDARLGITRASVKSASELTEVQKERLGKKLNEYTGMDVRLGFIVDPAILGGLFIKFADTVIDATIRTRLERLKTKFLEAGISYS